jgi:hypothetical protein
MSEIFIRFLVGGTVVSLFALTGDVLKPKSFAGLFGAAPSVALATLTLTILQKTPGYAAIECRSMLPGAGGLLFYCLTVGWMLRRGRRALESSVLSLPIWFGVTFGLWFIFDR